MDWRTLLPVDARGWPLPAEVSYPFGSLGQFMPGQERSVVIHLKMRREGAEAIKNFSAQFE